MVSRTVRRLMRSAVGLGRWYLTPTGIAFLVGLAASVVLAVNGFAMAGLVCAFGTVAVILPWRLARVENARAAVPGQIATARDSALRAAVRHADERAGQATTRASQRSQTLRRDLLGVFATMRSETADLLRAERTAWSAALADATTNALELNQQLSDRVATQEEDVYERIGFVEREIELQSTPQVKQELLEQVERRLATARAQVALSLARRDADRNPFDALLLIVCVQRVGSTLLLDVLRQHPAIDMRGTADIYRRLGVSGRRYPAHLTNLATDGLELEVQDGVGGTIPRLGTEALSAPHEDPHYAIEKVHPSAIGYDTDGFVERVEAMRKALGGEDRVRTVYIARNPIETMRSFVSYRRRDAEWHRDIPEGMVHDFYSRSYAAVVELYRALPGPTVTFEALTADPGSTVGDLLVDLGVDDDGVDAREFAARAASNADLAARGATGSKFFSPGADKPTVADIELGLASDDPARAQLALDRCRAAWREIVGTAAPASS